MGFFDEMKSGMEEKQIEKVMAQVGAYKGTHSENCERCSHYVSPPRSGSKYFGGCTRYGIKVFSSYVCNDYVR
jgi:hypothetical protein